MHSPGQLRDWRRRIGLTQRDAADRLGVSRRQYQAYEAGTPIPWTVVLATRAISAGLDSDRDAHRAVERVAEQAARDATHSSPSMT